MRVTAIFSESVMTFAADKNVWDAVTGQGMNQWPAEARERMQSLIATPASAVDERKLPRNPYFLRTQLLMTGPADTAVTVYTKDVNTWTVGFLTTVPMPPGTKAVVELIAPDGRHTAVGCRVRRCQEFAGGWFESFAEFGQPRYSFENL